MSQRSTIHSYNQAATTLKGWAGRPVSLTVSEVPSGGSLVAIFSAVEIIRVAALDDGEHSLAGEAVEIVLGAAGQEIGSIFVEEQLLEEAIAGTPFDLDLSLGRVWVTITDETREEDADLTLSSAG